jgi:hypothetical protein
MSKRLLSIAGGLALTVTISGATLAQDSQNQTQTTVTTQTTQAVQNADGSWTVIEYPANKEVYVDLTPGTNLTGAKGRAKVMRMSDHTMIDLDLAGLTGDTNNYNLYAVDPFGKVTLLGPVTANNGVATQSFKTPLNRFMLVLSPQSDLTTIGADTPIAFRSAVPQGMAVIPVAQSGPQDGAPVGERVAATTTPGNTSAYNVPMLGIPNFRRGTDTHMRVNFTGDLAGARANVFIEPRKDGATTIKMRFHSLTRVPADKRIVLWAVAPDNTYTRLGQVVNTRNRNEAQIQTETALKDFGLFVTMEDTDDVPSPHGPLGGTIVIGK